MTAVGEGSGHGRFSTSLRCVFLLQGNQTRLPPSRPFIVSHLMKKNLWSISSGWLWKGSPPVHICPAKVPGRVKCCPGVVFSAIKRYPLCLVGRWPGGSPADGGVTLLSRTGTADRVTSFLRGLHFRVFQGPPVATPCTWKDSVVRSAITQRRKK